ncbi:MAG: ATP-dependent helicase, partial [Candidatus Aminicenantaceae bacterium]
MAILSSKESLHNLLKDLNPAQKAAVIHEQHPLLIIAGAGTGKTKVITHRIAYLVASKLAQPEEILAVTFTEKAANEMEERVDVLIPYSYSFVEISTFNSFGERILRDYGLELGLSPDFKLLDEVEQAIFFRKHIFKFPMKYFRPLSSPIKYIQGILGNIKKLKQEDVKPEEYLEYSKDLEVKASNGEEEEVALKHREMADIYSIYQQMLREEGKIDFEDQVMLVIDLLKKRPSVLQKLQDKYKYILVDEFQDTNYVQFELLKFLAAKHENITVVGDDDQSIFRFRGASLSNILNFMDYYPDAKTIVLTTNYRSTQAILDSAYKLIKLNNPNRLEYKLSDKIDIKKHLKSIAKETGKDIFMLQFDTISHEADRIAEIIAELGQRGFKYSDCAILVRRNTDAIPFLKALNIKEIPYRFSGSRGLYSREEVKILIAFIRALTDFDDSKSLFFLALSQIYKVDPYDLTLVSNYAQKKNITLHKLFKGIYEGKNILEISSLSKEKIGKIYSNLLYFIKFAASQNAGRVIYAFLEKSGFLKSLIEEQDLEAEVEIKNIRIFFDKVKNFSELVEDDSIYAFSQHLELLQQVGDNPASAEAELEQDAVNVLTVHKAKGLEFSVVFMVSLIKDRFPGRNVKDKIPIPIEIMKEELPEKENYLQEERRLFYVGMTRAKKLLYFTWAKDYGLKRLKKVSPFILEALDLSNIPDEVIRKSDAEEIKRYSAKNISRRNYSIGEGKAVLSLSYFQVENYLTCPMKYKFKHKMKIQVPPSHNVVFGRVLHNAIYFYLMNKMKGKKISEEEFLSKYRDMWINEGYLSREHEEMRKNSGEKALRMFYRKEEKSDRSPLYIEQSFKWYQGNVRFTGRWDRIEQTKKGILIMDYKATEVKDQKTADEKAENSLQMNLYALSFVKTQDEPLYETQLYFLESGIIGHSKKQNKDLEKAEQSIKETEEGIR